jgi:hypothetical protein
MYVGGDEVEKRMLELDTRDGIREVLDMDTGRTVFHARGARAPELAGATGSEVPPFGGGDRHVAAAQSTGDAALFSMLQNGLAAPGGCLVRAALRYVLVVIALLAAAALSSLLGLGLFASLFVVLWGPLIVAVIVLAYKSKRGRGRE